MIEATCDAPYVYAAANADASGKAIFSIIEYDPAFTQVTLDPNTNFANAKAAAGSDPQKYLKSDSPLLYKNNVYNMGQGVLGDLAFKITTGKT